MISVEVTEEAVKAAMDFVKTHQQTAFIAGRGRLQEEFERFKNNGIANTIRCLQNRGTFPVKGMLK